jgi:hypothetical protein
VIPPMKPMTAEVQKMRNRYKDWGRTPLTVTFS